MKNYEKYFENYEIPERLKNTAIAILNRGIAEATETLQTIH